MEELSEQQREILLFVHQSQHEESLQHRRSILNAFSLSILPHPRELYRGQDRAEKHVYGLHCLPEHCNQPR